ncbi:MAG: hypothetical protein KAS32_24620 [Candidatus Peribacteraceae bacterium]|nr:hypothetical protein [Candidatus Peribacteraceae bacterium]
MIGIEQVTGNSLLRYISQRIMCKTYEYLAFYRGCGLDIKDIDHSMIKRSVIKNVIRALWNYKLVDKHFNSLWAD